MRERTDTYTITKKKREKRRTDYFGKGEREKSERVRGNQTLMKDASIAGKRRNWSEQPEASVIYPEDTVDFFCVSVEIKKTFLQDATLYSPVSREKRHFFAPCKMKFFHSGERRERETRQVEVGSLSNLLRREKRREKRRKRKREELRSEDILHLCPVIFSHELHSFFFSFLLVNWPHPGLFVRLVYSKLPPFREFSPNPSLNNVSLSRCVSLSLFLSLLLSDLRVPCTLHPPLVHSMRISMV